MQTANHGVVLYPDKTGSMDRLIGVAVQNQVRPRLRELNNRAAYPARLGRPETASTAWRASTSPLWARRPVQPALPDRLFEPEVTEGWMVKNAYAKLATRVQQTHVKRVPQTNTS